MSVKQLVDEFLKEHEEFVLIDYDGEKDVISSGELVLWTIFHIDNIKGVFKGVENVKKAEHLIKVLNEEDEVEYNGEIYTDLFDLMNDAFSDEANLVQFTQGDGQSTPYLFEYKDDLYAYTYDKVVKLNVFDLEYRFAVMENWWSDFETLYRDYDTLYPVGGEADDMDSFYVSLDRAAFLEAKEKQLDNLDEFIVEALKRRPSFLKEVDSDLVTPELCNELVKHDWRNVRYVDAHLITPELCMIAYEQNPKAELYFKI